ncbi:hypothetical protein Q5752_001868 [Cryptotrichosporon argae]
MSTMSGTTTPAEACVDCAPGPSSSVPVATAAPGPAAATNEELADIVPPTPAYPHITIEFCDRCRWAPRATWVQTELFLTFPSPAVRAITLVPLNAPETGGRFRVWVDLGGRVELAWDRKTEGGFPELKILKQRIRNLVQPGLDLGHSDKPSSSQAA